MRRRQFAKRRKMMGYSQEAFAEKLDVDRSTVCRWDAGDTEPSPWFRKPIAAALGLTLAELDDLLNDFAVPLALDTPPEAGITVGTSTDDGSDPMDRRSFNALAAVTSLGVVGPLRDVFATAEPPRSIGMDHVRLATSLAERLRLADSATGANELCDVAIEAHRKLLLWGQHSRYGREVSDALQPALADLANEVGWLTIDAERRPESRPYLHEAIARARLADDPQREVRALACLSLLTRETRPSESLQGAEAALRRSAGWATPRLSTLLHLRTALAHAHLGDDGGFGRETAKAWAMFDRGPSEDDLPWLSFVTEAEVIDLGGLAQLALGRAERAVTAFATPVPEDPVHRRNQIGRRVLLANAAAQQGDMSRSAEVAHAVLPEVAGLKSRRTSLRLAKVATALEPHRDSAPAVRDFLDAHHEIAA